MTPKHPPQAGSESFSSEMDLGEDRRIAGAQLAKLWLSEVPKVVQRHEAERLQVRKALGLIS
jgi:hypothetical protein